MAAINDIEKKFLTCHKKNFAPMLSNLFNTLAYPFWAYLFIVHLNWGIQGCAVTDLVSMIITLIFNYAYSHWSEDLKESMVPVNFNEFVNFGEQLRLSFYSALNSMIDGFAIQILMILSGFLSVSDQAANAIVMNIVLMLQSIGVGFMSSATIFVGSQIGKNDVSGARRYYFAHFAVCLVLCIISSTLLFIFKEIIVSQYTRNEEIAERCEGALMVVLIYILADSIKGVYKGTAKALSLYKQVIGQNMFCSFVVNLCMVYYLAFHCNLGLTGIWAGKLIGDIVNLFCYNQLIEKLDWESLSFSLSRITHSKSGISFSDSGSQSPKSERSGRSSRLQLTRALIEDELESK